MKMISKRTKMIHYWIRFVAIVGSLAIALYFLLNATAIVAYGDDGSKSINSVKYNSVKCENGSCQFNNCYNGSGKVAVRSSACSSCNARPIVRGVSRLYGATKVFRYRIRSGFGAILRRR